MPARMKEDHDSPWKEALECFFQSFLQLLYADIHKAIDWQRPFMFLDKELQKVTRNSHTGRRHADKLVKVWFRDGMERWLLIHVEVQGGRDATFAERMFVYYHRIRDHYRMDVISLAVLADTDPRYRPDSFETLIAGSGVHFRFRTVKLLDFEQRMNELLGSDNPFALLVAAQLTAKRVKDGRQRVDSLIGFYRLAARQRLDRELIARLLVFLEWLVALPPGIESYYTEQVDLLEEEDAMPYVSILERRAIERGIQKGIEKGIEQGIEQGLEKGIKKGLERGIEKGIEKGLAQGIEQGLEKGIRIGEDRIRATILLRLLELKFGELPEGLRPRIEDASEGELDVWVERILFADNIENIFR